MITNEADAKDQELISDIKEECGKYGTIKSMQVFVKSPNDVRIFLEYENHSGNLNKVKSNFINDFVKMHQRQNMGF